MVNDAINVFGKSREHSPKPSVLMASDSMMNAIDRNTTARTIGCHSEPASLDLFIVLLPRNQLTVEAANVLDEAAVGEPLEYPAPPFLPIPQTPVRVPSNFAIASDNASGSLAARPSLFPGRSRRSEHRRHQSRRRPVRGQGPMRATGVPSFRSTPQQHRGRRMPARHSATSP